ncbi:MAG: choice-of-anchor D domain-containing protein [Ilumatobacteraceae bacterium]
MPSHPSARSPLRWAAILAVAAFAVHAVTSASAVSSAVPGGAVDRTAVETNHVRVTAAAAAGTQGRMPSVSGDGRLVVSLAAATDDRAETVVLTDRTSGVVSDLMPMPSGLAPGESRWPVLSGDGCTVTVLTELALDRYRDGERGGRWDVYQRRLDQCGGSGDWQLVSGGSGAGLSAEASNSVDPRSAPAVSADGATVVYAERRDDGRTSVLVVVDTMQRAGAAQRQREVSSGTGVQIVDPTIDGAGRVLAATVESGDATTARVLVWSLDAVADTAPTGVPGSGRSWQPALSGDGSVLAFVSDAPDVVPGATMGRCLPECAAQVYVYRFADRTTILVSRTPRSPADEPVAGNGPSTQPALGEAGAEVVFVTRATNFFTTRHRSVGAADDGELVRVAVSSGVMWREHHDADGVSPVPRVYARPSVSANARVVASDAASSAGTRVIDVIEVSPRLDVADLDVGTTGLGFASLVASMTVTNAGPSVFVPTFADVDVLDFSVVGGTCTAVGRVVEPGSSCTVDVAFSPGSTGAQSATLRVGEDGPGGLTVTTAVRGAGGDPVLVSMPNTVDLSTQVVGEVGSPVSVYFTNTSAARVRVATVLVGGAHADDFEVIADECSGVRLRPNRSCRVDVRFAPHTAGTRRASLRATAESGAYTTVALDGVARYAPTIRLTRGALRRTDDVVAAMVGTRLVITGDGFAPSAPVVVLWGDGIGRVVRVTADEDGHFRARVVVLPGERLGVRTLVALAVDHAATLRVRVVNAPPR